MDNATANDSASKDPVAIRVWDWPVRLMHWAMVVLLVVLLATAKIGGDAMAWHIRAGEAMLAVVLFRVVWGFAGTYHARFSSFVRGPRAVIAYTRSVLTPRRQLHVGHNPLGGWAVVALLLALLFQALTGLFTNDDVLIDGPLVPLIAKNLSDTISSFHRWNAWIVVALASAHIGAVLFYVIVLRDNLIKPMLDGAKSLPATRAIPPRGGSLNGVKAALLFAACAALVGWVVARR